MNAFLLSLVTFVSTSVGGLCALRFRDRLHFVLGFIAGVLLGVDSFDLLPEIFELSRRLGSDGEPAMVALAGGFLLFHGLEKFVLVHRVHEAEYAHHHHPSVGVLSAVALIGHSFMDGVGIGLAFQVSPPVGLTVAVAVIAHDFCDGLNTVSLMLMHRNTTTRALGMLALDAIAPVLGAVSTLAFSVPPERLVLYLNASTLSTSAARGTHFRVRANAATQQASGTDSEFEAALRQPASVDGRTNAAVSIGQSLRTLHVPRRRRRS